MPSKLGHDISNFETELVFYLKLIYFNFF
ncbi:hypothetical protein F383_27284 [Gossypium arboreum]|uniref:Uncharacterized protein n=1 Tax=Gossypium arboreum TaxID=29729 RepID=A0A0B0P239_GOSAR|nr:hypothetical protein F383_07859 [Gossypium arboreum]KHG22188.1 hypothetical protein F383_27284 [Gossypium arboreum]